MAWTAPKTWSVGELVTASNMNIHLRDNMLALGPHILVRKTADEAVTSSTVLQNDDHLVTPSIAANEIWLLRWIVIFTAANGTGDLKTAFTFPSGRIDFMQHWTDNAGTFGADTNLHSDTTSPSTAKTANGRGTTIRVPMVIEGVFANGATPGAVQLQWAQNTSSGTSTTVYTNSSLWGVKLA